MTISVSEGIASEFAIFTNPIIQFIGGGGEGALFALKQRTSRGYH